MKKIGSLELHEWPAPAENHFGSHLTYLAVNARGWSFKDNILDAIDTLRAYTDAEVQMLMCFDRLPPEQEVWLQMFMPMTKIDGVNRHPIGLKMIFSEWHDAPKPKVEGAIGDTTQAIHNFAKDETETPDT